MADRPLAQQWLLDVYGARPPEVHSFKLGEHWLSYSGGSVFWQSTRLLNCTGSLNSVVQQQVAGRTVYLAGCQDELVLLSDSGELIERLGAAYNLPQPMDALGYCGAEQQLCLRSGQQLLALDLDTLDWQALNTSLFAQELPATAPAPLTQLIQQQWLNTDLNWERLMLDLHAGRIFGLGPWLMDLVALLLVMLALSGLAIWLAGYLRRANR